MPEPVTTTRTELAQRSSAGIDVTLLWSRRGGADQTVVCVCDRREGAYFEIPADPRLALEVYHHPFFYRNFIALDYEDRRLVVHSEPEGAS
jgi:hypothetical protein